MIIRKMPPYNPIFHWSVSSQVTRYGDSMSKWTEYRLENGKRLVTIHSHVNGRKVLISKTLYDKYKILKEKVIQFVNGERKVDRIM